MDFLALMNLYKNTLFGNVIRFWQEHSGDEEYGGYFTCLDRQGNVFDTDKFVWLQGREVWMFAKLYNELKAKGYEYKEEWKDFAIYGGEFLLKHGHDGNYEWYFSLTREGKPLIYPYNIFSYCFAVMAFGYLYKTVPDPRYKDAALKTFYKILERRDNPKGIYEKGVPGTRPLRNFALPMILCNLALEIRELIDPELFNTCVNDCIEEVFKFEKDGIIVENLGQDYELVDSFEGRVVNPGHAIEAMWFIMDLGELLGRPELIERACGIVLKMLEYGWDEKYEGIFYFKDRKGFPPQQLEWDQKLWWVHIESLIACIKGYQLTGSQDLLQWFEKLHKYTWSHFADPEYPEWWGYLNRQGEVLLDLKGGKWKGCFHVPRGLFKCWTILEEIVKNEKRIK